MPTIPDDLKNLDISCENIFVKTFKNFEKATRRDTVDCCFDDDNYEKDKIPTAEIDNDPEDPSHEDNDKTVDVTEVIKIIRESKTRPKLELPNDHDRKGPKLHNDNESNKFMEKIPSKIDVGVKGKMDTHNDVHLSFDEIENNEQMDVNSPLKNSRPRSTLYLVTKSILLFVIPAVLIYMICASARGNEPGDLQPRQLKPGKGGGYNQFLEGQDSEDSQQTRPFTGNHRPNRYPTPPGTEDENSGLEVAKRKTLDVLIKKDLQKKEREKQKNMEREQMEQEKKEAEKHREETKKEAKNDKTNDGKFHILKKSRFDTDDEEDESSLPSTPVKGRSMFKKRVKRRSPSPQKFKSEEKKQMDITSKCKAHRTPVFNISASSYKNLESCEFELDRLSCKTDHIRACISDWKKDLWALCTEDLCLLDDACPVLTKVEDQKMSLVVQSIHEETCGNCSDSLKKRLQQGQNCHKNFYRTTTMAAPSIKNETVNRTTVAISSLGDGGSGSGFEAGVVVAVVIILIIVVWVVVGVVFYKKNLFGFKDSVQQHITDICRRRRFQQNNNTEVQDVDPPEQAQPMIHHGNQETGNNASPVDQERNRGGSIELQTQNGGAGSEPLMQNGGVGSEPLMQNGGVGSQLLTQNGEQGDAEV